MAMTFGIHIGHLGGPLPEMSDMDSERHRHGVAPRRVPRVNGRLRGPIIGRAWSGKASDAPGRDRQGRGRLSLARPGPAANAGMAPDLGRRGLKRGPRAMSSPAT